MLKQINFLREEDLNKDSGFSLLELVVAVGILLVLTVGGLLAYNGITNNARDAAVQKAANEVYDVAMARYAGGNTGLPEDADTDWNDSADESNHVTTEVTDLTNGRYEVRAWYGESYESSDHRFTLTTPEGGNGGSVSPEPENPGSGEEDDLSFLDNPNQLPAAIVPVGNCSPETERQKAGIFLDESLRRGELFREWYSNNLENGEVDGEELSRWQTAFAAEFIDTDCGTFTMATQTSNSVEGAYVHFGIILIPSGGGYYTMGADGNPEDIQMYIDAFGIQEF